VWHDDRVRANHGRARPAGAIATKAVEKLVPRDRLRLTRVQIAWSAVAPGRLREVAWPGSLASATLTVHVLDNQWLHELVYMRTELLERVQRACPDVGIEALRMRVGPIAELPPDAPEPDGPAAPTLPDEPDPDTIDALNDVGDADLQQAMANARLALSGRLRRG
jgi:hypothetical protein